LNISEKEAQLSARALARAYKSMTEARSGLGLRPGALPICLYAHSLPWDIQEKNCEGLCQSGVDKLCFLFRKAYGRALNSCWRLVCVLSTEREIMTKFFGLSTFFWSGY
jgi:hypothetical protein